MPSAPDDELANAVSLPTSLTFDLNYPFQHGGARPRVSVTPIPSRQAPLTFRFGLSLQAVKYVASSRGGVSKTFPSVSLFSREKGVATEG